VVISTVFQEGEISDYRAWHVNDMKNLSPPLPKKRSK